MDRSLDPQLRKVICASVISVVSICGQFTTVLMATDEPPKAQSRSARSGSSLMNSAARAANVTPAAAIVGMQESIDRIGDILEKFVTSPAATSLSHCLLNRLQYQAINC
ncbi:hypothetical protein K503DRAFT_856128 [Rhizopogon vinicolor AM-OR11-026]|uniref:Uncharacterized protein n=1 Tax=Rhizopogon vinicolor AM-OR11-026 TaxID=1314800 RepID=A0A1B7N386_9AGAM|nr:hypothetical protein K503DRAFT_856128 [Rhizopogon vinicolor AM-OR11-026]